MDRIFSGSGAGAASRSGRDEAPGAPLYTKSFSTEQTSAIEGVLGGHDIPLVDGFKGGGGRGRGRGAAHGWFERYEGAPVQFTVRGLYSWGNAEKKAIAGELREALRGSGCRVSVDKDTLLINAPNAAKADAAADFARRTGVPLGAIVRFGDNPARADAGLLAERGVSYHVGDKPPPEDFPATWVGETSGVQGARAVLEVLDGLDRTGRPPRALILDFDGTAGGKTEDGSRALDEVLARRLVELLRREPPVHLAFASLRGESLVPLVVDGLRRAGATDAELRQVILYLSSGAVALRAVP